MRGGETSDLWPVFAPDTPTIKRCADSNESETFMMNMNNVAKLIVLSIFTLLMTACGSGNDSGATPEATTAPAQTVTLDARGKEVYETNCKVCHGMPNSGAPQSGEPSDWHERTAAGMEIVLDNVIEGVQAMPPMGGCYDCSDEDFRQLITFMTSGTLK